MYRSMAMRAAYLAQDRPDLQTAMRSLVTRSTESNVKALGHVRYRPRVSQLFPNQSACNPVNMWPDRRRPCRMRKDTKECVRKRAHGQQLLSHQRPRSCLLKQWSMSVARSRTNCKGFGIFPNKEVTMETLPLA